MANDNKSQGSNAITTQNLEQVQQAMESYVQFWGQMLSATPWGKTELAKKLAECAQQNITNSFDVVQRMTQAKDVQDIVQIQADFFKSQMNVLNEQAKDIGVTITEAAKSRSKSE